MYLITRKQEIKYENNILSEEFNNYPSTLHLDIFTLLSLSEVQE